MKRLVILGSARPDGETRTAVDLAFPPGSVELAALPNFAIGGYDYDHVNASDDFDAVARKMAETETIIFATPVYWYAMSAPMKVFFDRLTDMTENLKFLGKALAGKDVWLIATGTEPALPDGFEVPFSRTAAYFGMHYRGAGYLCTGDNISLRARGEEALAAFGRMISAT